MGRSASRQELEGFGVNPNETRAMLGGGDRPTSSGAGRTTRYELRRRASGQMPEALRHARSRCRSLTRRSGSRPPAPDGHYVGSAGMGVGRAVLRRRCAAGGSRSPRVAAYREGPRRMRSRRRALYAQRARRDLHHGALRRHQRAVPTPKRRNRWSGTRSAARRSGRRDTAAYARQFNPDGDLGTYFYTESARNKTAEQSGALEALNFDYIKRFPRRDGGRPGPLHRDRETLRGRGLRSPLLSLESLQDRARAGHEVDRTDRTACDPRVRSRLTRLAPGGLRSAGARRRTG